MTAEEIRNQVNDWHKWIHSLAGDAVLQHEIQIAQVKYLAEIAAQLAELNQLKK